MSTLARPSSEVTRAVGLDLLHEDLPRQRESEMPSSFSLIAVGDCAGGASATVPPEPAAHWREGLPSQDRSVAEGASRERDE